MIAIQTVSGGVAIMRLVGDADAQTCVNGWKDVNPDQYVSHAEVAEESLPDRSTRATWTLVDGAVVADPTRVPIPQIVTRRQAKEALRRAGKLSLVQPAIDAITDAAQRAAMQIEWDDSQELDRARPSLMAMATAMGLNSADIDALFIEAAGL